MSSLQDQLLKAGLVNEKQAKAVNKDKRKAVKVQQKSKTVVVDEAKAAARRALEEKVERDRLLNAERNAEIQKRAIAAQIRQLIETNRQSRGGGDVPYHFTDDGRIKKLHVSAKVQNQLTYGWLAIVRFGEGYELVPAVVAEKIAQRDESAVLVLNNKPEVVEEDDPYADYKIPDDLMW